MATNASVNQGTQRKDAWQVEPTLIFLGFLGFIVYATWAAFTPGPVTNPYYTVPGTNYLSPMFSPNIYEILHTLGVNVEPLINNAGVWFVTPALFILWAPAGFRTTCYYYRKAYYRSFFGSPAGCAVGDDTGNPLFDVEASTLGRLLGRGRKYLGETAFPLILQNLHRYFFYVAAGFIAILAFDAVISFFASTDATGLNKKIDWGTIRVGVGSAVMTLNVILLALYTFSCHSYRHILGGQIDCFSACPMGPERHEAWSRQSLLNGKHMEFAWMSLFSVGFTDLYIRLVSMGVWTDLHLPEWHWAWWG